jgi:hypothetical protein
MPNSLNAAVCRLADVLELENAALRVMDLRRAASLLPEKTEAHSALMAFGEIGSAITEPALAQAAARLKNRVLENRQLLERAIVAQQRVIGIVVRAAAAARGAGPVYGTRGGPTRATLPMALSTRA